MTGPVVAVVDLATDEDVGRARQQARQVAALAGLDSRDQVRVAAAVSEIARNAQGHAGGGRVEFSLGDAGGPALVVEVADGGRGIADLDAVLAVGPGRAAVTGIAAARRLMDSFRVESNPGGTLVSMAKRLPPGRGPARAADLARSLARQSPESPLDEMRRQNRELVAALAELETREDELAQVNRELEETNTGILALYAELEERSEHLHRVGEANTQFFRSVSHELRTPTHAIVALARMLLEAGDGELGAEQLVQARLIVRAAEALVALVDDLLDLAKAKAGRIEVTPATFEVAEMKGGLRGLLRPLAASDAVAVVFEADPALPRLHTDEVRLTQILRNLVANGLKYTERGEVRTTISSAADGWVEFRVSDTGIGIAAADQDHIFEEFTQLAHPLQSRVKGTGLGLALCRRLAEALGGRIDVASAPGVGSTFTLRLPPSVVPAGGPVDVSDRPPAVVATALVVDNDEAYRYVLRDMLRGTATAVVDADGGEEGVRLARRLRPDVVLLDLSMPDLDGRGVLAALRADPQTAALPVVVVTARELGPAEREALEREAGGVLWKGLLSAELLAAEVLRVTATPAAQPAGSAP